MVWILNEWTGNSEPDFCFSRPFISAIRPIGYWSLIYILNVFLNECMYIFMNELRLSSILYLLIKRDFWLKRFWNSLPYNCLLFSFFGDGVGWGWVDWMGIELGLGDVFYDIDLNSKSTIYHYSILVNRWYWYALKRPINTSPECIGSVDKRQMPCRNIHTIQITC